MHELLFHRQKALADEDLRAYAQQVGLDSERFERERVGREVLDRVVRDVATGEASAVVRGTPTLFINGYLYEGPYDTPSLIEVLSRAFSFSLRRRGAPRRAAIRRAVPGGVHPRWRPGPPGGGAGVFGVVS